MTKEQLRKEFWKAYEKGEANEFLDQTYDRIREENTNEARKVIEGMIPTNHEHTIEYCGVDHRECGEMLRQIEAYTLALHDVLTAIQSLITKK